MYLRQDFHKNTKQPDIQSITKPIVLGRKTIGFSLQNNKFRMPKRQVSQKALWTACGLKAKTNQLVAGNGCRFMLDWCLLKYILRALNICIRGLF